MNKKQITFAIIFSIVFIQIFRIEKTNPIVEENKNFISLSHSNDDINSLIKIACYDCHSNEVSYPWYSNIAPFSWWIKHHINEARSELYFSEWGYYSRRKSDHKLKECIEMIKKNEMPINSYLIMNSKAKLNNNQKAKLISWFKSLRNFESDKPKKINN